MKRIIGMTVTLAAVLASSPGAAQVQLFGNPVYVPVGQATGINLAGDFGKGLNDASYKTTYFGGRATLGLSFLYITASVGSVKADSALSDGMESEMTYGGSLGFNLLRLPMMPVKISIQAGGNYTKIGEDKQIDVPIALGIGLSLPTPGISVTPWVAPRLHVRAFSPASDLLDTSTKARFGGSAGINASFGMIGAHLAVDYLKISPPDGSGLSSGDVSPWVFGAGINLGLSVPGM